MKKLNNNESGFGAVEVLIAIVIIGLLSAVGWLVYDRQKDSKKVDTAQSTNNIEKPQEKNNDSSKTTNQPPEGWVEFKDSATGIAFYHPKDIEGTFKVTKYKTDEYISHGFGSPFWVAYNSSANSWQTYGMDAEKSTSNNIVKKPVTNSFTITTNKVGGKSTIFFNVGEGGSSQNYITFASSGSLYRIFFPVLSYSENSSSDYITTQDTAQKNAVEQLIQTIKL